MSEASSQAQYLFEKYSGDGAVDLLKSLPSLPEKTFESDWLDFKSLAVRIRAFQESPAPEAVDGIGSVNGLDRLLCVAGMGRRTRCHQVLAAAFPLAGAFLQFLTIRSRNTCRPVDALPEHSAHSHHRSAAGHLSLDSAA